MTHTQLRWQGALLGLLMASTTFPAAAAGMPLLSLPPEFMNQLRTQEANLATQTQPAPQPAEGEDSPTTTPRLDTPDVLPPDNADEALAAVRALTLDEDMLTRTPSTASGSILPER